MPKVEMTIKNGVQKGPATDYSMLLEMKRRNAIINSQIGKSPVGNQNNKPFIREDHLRAGSDEFTATGARYFYNVRGWTQNLYKF
jgi:hypothetical protein